MTSQTSFAKSIPLFLLSVLTAVPGAAATQTVTSLADDGSPGTLRSAIATAASGDTIAFNVTGTIVLAQGQLTISKNLAVSGPGASQLTISGNNLSRVFEISSGSAVSISGVTVANGNALNGGGVLNRGTLTIAAGRLTGNAAQGGDSYGGAIWSNGTATLSNTTISGNFAAGAAGGIANIGTLLLISSTLAANTAGNVGGAMYNAGYSTITNCTFSGNGSTIVFNEGSINISNSTFSGNAEGFANFGWSFAIKNTILAHTSSGGNCFIGGISSGGHNISDDVSCASFLTQGGDMNSTPAGLDPSGLKDNGGSTQTIALASGSVAIDAVPVTPVNYCTDLANNPVTTDQRDVSRPQGPACDIGAFELVQLPPADLGILKGAPSQVETGKSLTYGLGVVNFGPGPATSVKITDKLPAGTTFVAALVGQGACSVVNGQVTGCSMPNQPVPCTLNGGVVTCAIDHLDAYNQSHPTGGVALITLQVSAPAGTTLVNTGQVSAANPDPNTANNSSSVATQVTGEQ